MAVEKNKRRGEGKEKAVEGTAGKGTIHHRAATFCKRAAGSVVLLKAVQLVHFLQLSLRCTPANPDAVPGLQGGDERHLPAEALRAAGKHVGRLKLVKHGVVQKMHTVLAEPQLASKIISLGKQLRHGLVLHTGW